MLRILHAADLHLSEGEKEYSLSVLAELLDLASREQADFLVFCGDLFDTFADAEKLRNDFRRLLGDVRRPFEFLFLPGNHEAIRRGAGELSRLDFGPVTVLDKAPFDLVRRERDGMGVEFFAIPHQDHYAGYGNWPVPAKAAPWRIALAHGVVAGMAYRGPDSEGGGTALDPDLFARFAVDYAALGHIHGRRHQVNGRLTLAYPGSTRVWRKHESGPRGANLLELPYGPSGASRSLEPVFRPLASAGEYRHYSIAVTLEGESPDLDRLASTWGPRDHVELEFTGVVEDEHLTARMADELRSRHGGRIRNLEISREGVTALPGISSHPVARQFLDRWKARPEASEPTHSNYPAWLRARELALSHLKACLERSSAGAGGPA